MPKRIPATKKEVKGWFLHLLVFIVVNAILWYITYAGTHGFVYPWPIWITSAWLLGVVGHASIVWATHEDKAHDEWWRQVRN